METFLFLADINQPDRYNATAWDYARNRQLHYCQLIIMSHQRQRMMSNPTSPLPNGLGLLMHTENGVHEDFSRMVRKLFFCLFCPPEPRQFAFVAPSFCDLCSVIVPDRSRNCRVGCLFLCFMQHHGNDRSRNCRVGCLFL